MTKRGLFVTFEGIDGCGKSTQIFRLAKHLFDLSKYNNAILTREPYKNQDIRKILQEDSDPYSRGLKLAEMFVDDRTQHLKEIVSPGLASGMHVLSDRYRLSTMAYQQAQGVDFQELYKMHTPLLVPDLTYIVDVPVEVALERMKKDNNRGISEQKFEDPKNKMFIENLRQLYLGLPKQMPHSEEIVIVDGTQSPQEIFENQIKPVFDRVYQKWAAK